ncbi:CDP-diacylglycerol--glycerol-3-phosphate 3-phosphatidyltransferase [Magnetospirillum molischianum]|uniref:CDP-diacylglycerol--glycerol-3-phosphate 3-phosphatidyltransferase n=1 Tax=Magnetospirillum molischianum DSM 120 TaxID=1150626 RepID=H8FT21_MAGML|nr:CDP-diacylglycerol--glycerol-3-phosphate 3-phosphatidyltransferase [Magnetospirillum molischianum]CCG41509.1 Putative CDP-diacylglycerol-glycerol-3-phosphate 3-phosphatidyltransferase [Magnetospirillum molischianum DSM 120]
MVTSLPNLLTLSRIVVIPVMVALFYVDGPNARWAACGLFVAAAITDWFDGYVARSRNQVSTFGRFLDPIADKLLVVSVLFMLVAFNRVGQLSILSALIIVLREIMVSGLREFLAEVRVGLPVSRLAKWKTGIQMVAIPVLLVGNALPILPTQEIGEVGLSVAAALTLVTGWDYLQSGLRHIRANPVPVDPSSPRD